MPDASPVADRPASTQPRSATRPSDGDRHGDLALRVSRICGYQRQQSLRGGYEVRAGLLGQRRSSTHIRGRCHPVYAPG
jgi:hypothetical protein